jgi:hypothetical protein
VVEVAARRDPDMAARGTVVERYWIDRVFGEYMKL